MKKILFSLLGIVLLLSATSASAQPYKTEFSSGEIVVDSIKRSSDDTVLIKGSFRNTSEKGFHWHGSNLLQNYHIINIKLQDLKSKRQYEQVRVGDKAVGSEHQGSVSEGARETFWARITAPPRDVKEVSIIFGGEVIPIEGATIID
jgi:hypothetical protein